MTIYHSTQWSNYLSRAYLKTRCPSFVKFSTHAVPAAVSPWLDRSSFTAGVERCCACYHRHSEVWSRPGSDTTLRTALAWRSRPSSLQACSDSSPVSERPRTTVFVGALHRGLQCWQAAASAFRQPSSTCRTAFPAQHLRPSGVLGCWPDGPELSSAFCPGSNEQHRLFWAST